VCRNQIITPLFLLIQPKIPFIFTREIQSTVLLLMIIVEDRLYDNRLSTGPVEATNNKIKTIQRQAYGYRDQEFFRLKVYPVL